MTLAMAEGVMLLLEALSWNVTTSFLSSEGVMCTDSGLPHKKINV